VNALPDAATFASIASDPRFFYAVGISVLSGLVRGFSGFGSALIFVPLMSAVYEPRIAAASFLLIDLATGLTFILGVWRQANWREVLPLAASAAMALQLGTLILHYADPTTLRWVIAIMVALLLPVLMSGWRYHGRPYLIVTILVGLAAGTIGGAIQIAGPPVILYWLGSTSSPAVVRANFICYFALFALASFATYLWYGLLTPFVIALAVLIGPLHILAMWAGGKVFNLASETTYRRVAYVIVALAAVASLPVFDRFLR
jgi:uncharacterized membrane protein YfcA